MSGRNDTGRQCNLEGVTTNDAFIGGSHCFINNEGRTITPGPTGNIESADAVLAGVSHFSVNNNRTKLDVRSSGPEKITGMKVLSSKDVEISADNASANVEANDKGVATAYDVRDNENFRSNTTNGKISVRATNGGKASYSSGDRGTTNIRRSKISVQTVAN